MSVTLRKGDRTGTVTMDEAVRAIHAMFEEFDWRYDYNETQHRFRAGARLHGTKLGRIDIYIYVRARPDDASLCSRITSYGDIDLHADAECMDAVGEFLHRANYGLALGNFELDPEDGEMRYKVCLNCREALPSHDALDDLISLPMAMVERYGDGILKVCMGVATSKDAIKEIEGDR